MEALNWLTVAVNVSACSFSCFTEVSMDSCCFLTDSSYAFCRFVQSSSIFFCAPSKLFSMRTMDSANAFGISSLTRGFRLLLTVSFKSLSSGSDRFSSAKVFSLSTVLERPSETSLVSPIVLSAESFRSLILSPKPVTTPSTFFSNPSAMPDISSKAADLMPSTLVVSSVARPEVVF